MTHALVEELEWRGLIAQMSDRQKLVDYLEGGQRTLYCGFDPTADSLHIGSLVPLLTLKRFQEAGHRPILLVGGATGLIGDPSFKDEERNLNDESIVAQWVESIRRQAEPYLELEGNNPAIVANNLDWTQALDVISFLRDVGKHFSVNAMIARESVKQRLERPDQGISYTEFSYMLLQGMDFLELAKRHDCLLQIGGSDQWGNIVSGVDLIRRQLAKEAHAVTLPLVTKADGSKFGKTASGTVWLDAAKTSPYTFYQFWLNSADADVISYLKIFTFLSQAEIEQAAQSLAEQPQMREAQRLLAGDVTALVHGEEAVEAAQRISESLFKNAPGELTQGDFEQLHLDGIPNSEAQTGDGLLSAMADAGLTKSVGEARKLVQSGGVRLNGEVVEDPQMTLDFAAGYFGKYLLIRRGKKAYHLLTQAD